MAKSTVVQTLEKASKGLQYQSETDAPFTVVEWPGEKGKPGKARMLELAGLLANTPVRVQDLDAFFAEATEEKDWMDDTERAEAQRFQDLVQTIKGLLAGSEAGKDVFIVGRTESGWAGLRTKVVET